MGIYLLQHSINIQRIVQTQVIKDIQIQNTTSSKTDLMLSPWIDGLQLWNFPQLGKIQITTGIKSLRVDYATTATQVERMQAQKLIRYLTILNRIVEFIRDQ